MPDEQKSLLSQTRPTWRTKDLAVEMDLHPRNVAKWWKKLSVKPDKCDGNGCHRWSQPAAEKLMRRWRQWHAMRGRSPEIVKQKETGNFAPDDGQFFLHLNDK